MNTQPRVNTATAFFAAIAGIAAIVALTALYQQTIGLSVEARYTVPQVAEAKLAPGTEGLVKQTAEHLSKMQGGASVGGFPGFEPPDDKYRRKIEDRSYSGEDANGWIKEINNFLKQIADKNPGLTLEEILQRQGLAQAQIKQFIEAVRETHYVANSRVGYGVNLDTVKTLASLMERLGVSAWQY